MGCVNFRSPCTACSHAAIWLLNVSSVIVIKSKNESVLHAVITLFYAPEKCSITTQSIWTLYWYYCWFMHYQLLRLYSVRWLKEMWMTWKELVVIYYVTVLFRHLHEGTEEIQGKLNTSGVRASIWTSDFLNTKRVLGAIVNRDDRWFRW
jgi:hypothetical protein